MKLTKYERPGLVWPGLGRLAGLQDELDRLFESPLTGWRCTTAASSACS